MNKLRIGLLLLGFLLLFIESSTGYHNGIIFYDPATRKKLLPPIVTSTKYKNSLRMPFIGQPCDCKIYNCGCCVGINLAILNFDQRMCSNVTFDPNDAGLTMRITLNNKNLVMYNLSPFNPPPFCIPVGLPIPLSICVKLYDIKFQNSALNVCMDWLVQLFATDIFSLHFNCVKLSTGGIQFAPGNQQQMVNNATLAFPDNFFDEIVEKR